MSAVAQCIGLIKWSESGSSPVSGAFFAIGGSKLIKARPSYAQDQIDSGDEQVKKKMRASTWKTVQKTAYAFFAVIFVHLSGYLLFAAFQGSAKAQVSYSIYLFVAGLYLILRIRRAKASLPF